LYHIKDSLFVNDPRDGIGLGLLQLFGPAGPFAFGIANTAFVGGSTGLGAICAGQACGLGGAGGPCSVQYLLHQVDFSGIEPGNRILKFGVHSIDQGYVLPMFMADDNSLGGHRAIVSRHLHGFGKIPGCHPLGNEYDGGYACSRPVRRLNIWGRRSDVVQLTGPGYDVPPNMDAPVHGMDSGRLQYEPSNGRAYGTPVLVGETYQLSGQWDGDIVVEFSDPAIGLHFQEPDEAMRVQLDSVTCELRASDDRRYLGPKGPVQKVLNTHTSIRGGQMLCGGPASPHSLSAPPCSRLPDAERVCSKTETGCRVLAGNAPGRTCANYCAQAGLASTGAWEEKPGTCQPHRPLGSNEALSGSSSELLCECSEVASTVVNIIWKPKTTVPLSRFPECTTMRGVKERCSKSGCQVLVVAKSCSDYCQANDLKCIGAWWPAKNTCSAKAHLECDHVSSDAASSLICECELEVPSVERSPTTTAIRAFSVTGTEEVKTFHISLKEGYCLQALDATAQAPYAHTAKCNATDRGQRWSYNKATQQLRNEMGMCLEAVARRRVAAVECNAPKMAQRWGRKAHTGHIRNKEQGICLEATGKDLVLVWECSSKVRGQKWDFATLPESLRATE